MVAIMTSHKLSESGKYGRINNNTDYVCLSIVFLPRAPAIQSFVLLASARPSRHTILANVLTHQLLPRVRVVVYFLA
jgi:hypothetical protein